MTKYKNLKEQLKEKVEDLNPPPPPVKPPKVEARSTQATRVPISQAPVHVKIGNLWQEVAQPPNPRLLKVSIMGAPNAGKSTLVNKIIGQKISIVSPLAQTTRDQVIGSLTEGSSQLVFYDTPGIVTLEETKRIPRSIITSAWNSLHGANLVLLVVDAMVKKYSILSHMLEHYKKDKEQEDLTMVLVLNKADLSTPTAIQYLAEKLSKEFAFDDTFVVSALTGQGVPDLKEHLIRQAVPGNWLYSRETRSDMSDLDKVTEIIREKLFCRLRQELPYVIKQRNFGWTETGDGLRIDQDILVEKDSQRRIVLGSKGSQLREIQKDATEDLQKILNKKVRLFLNVKLER